MRVGDKFKISYGTKLDLNKLREADASSRTAVNFVNRSESNLGITARVERLDGVAPYRAGLVTVALGGSVLSSFVQPGEFYTGQNVAVLEPRGPMSRQEAIYYCVCIRKNAYRYRSHGREANRTLTKLAVPDRIPRWVARMPRDAPDVPRGARSVGRVPLSGRGKRLFEYRELFDIARGSGVRVGDVVDGGRTPLISATSRNNGKVGSVDDEPVHQAGTITVSNNGSVGEAFYQPRAYCATVDVSVFRPLAPVDAYASMFLVATIRQEQYRYNFGRKWNLARMRSSIMRLPVDGRGNPDWGLMSRYVKSLPYSCNL